MANAKTPYASGTPPMAIRDKRQRWDLLNQLLDRAESRGLEALSVEQIQQLARLYRQVAIDLSRARVDRDHPQRIAYLNRLAARAHGQVYRSRRIDLRPALMFLVTGFPRLFRRHWIAMVCAFGIFWGAALASFAAVVIHPDTAYVLFDEGTVEYENIRLEKQHGEYRGNFSFTQDQSALVGAMIILNNVRVAMMTFAFGALLGLPCLYLLLYNGRMLGTLEGLTYNHGFFQDFNALVLTHGVLELTAICISGGAGFLLALAIIAPGNHTRRDALKSVARDAFGLLAGSIAILVGAGIIEAYVTPHYSQSIRWSVAAVTAAFLILYFGFVGRQPSKEFSTENSEAPAEAKAVLDT